jgi:hypothetical protein
VHEVWDVVEVAGVMVERLRRYVDGELVDERLLLRVEAPQWR